MPLALYLPGRVTLNLAKLLRSTLKSTLFQIQATRIFPVFTASRSCQWYQPSWHPVKLLQQFVPWFIQHMWRHENRAHSLREMLFVSQCWKRPIRSLLSGHLHFGGVTGNTQLGKYIISDCKILHKNKEEGSMIERSAMRNHEKESKLMS